MSYTRDAAVFRDRALNAGLSDVVVDLLKEGGIDTIAKTAFCSSYLPGNPDESPMQQALKDALQRDYTTAEMASFRYLYNECYAIVSQEMKILVERSADANDTRRLTNVERADRYQKQVKRLAGLNIKGFLEPSDSLVDIACTQYDNNRLAYIPWEKCTSRSDEQEKDLKKDQTLTLDVSSGKLKVDKKRDEVLADIQSDLKVQQALQRRALAYDQANVIGYHELSRWHDKLLKARLTDPPPGYSRITFGQMERADRKFFAELCDQTRGGIQMVNDGRPVETVLKDCMFDAEVLHCLQPLPASQSSNAAVINRRQQQCEEPTVQDVKRQRKIHAFGQGKGKGKVMPHEMVALGCRATTNAGQPICYSFSLGNCSEKPVKGRCSKGFHVCAIPGCGGHHAAKDCPKRTQGS